MTHPFHPLFGREFELLATKYAWGEERVYFRDGEGNLRHLPTGWTSAVDTDAFRVIAAGRCAFRTEDLLLLADLIERLKSGGVR